ncbi:MAG: hypothetical protein Q9191_007928 [Dirinaria sp. TL-2023a]
MSVAGPEAAMSSTQPGHDENASEKDPKPQYHSNDLESTGEKGSEGSTELHTPPRQIRGIKWLIVVSSILSTTFLFSLDNTVVADIQPQIIKRFDNISKLPWLGAAFALGSAASILPWFGSLAEAEALENLLINVQEQVLWCLQYQMAVCGYRRAVRGWECAVWSSTWHEYHDCG